MDGRRLFVTWLQFLMLFVGGALLIMFWATSETLFIKRIGLAEQAAFIAPVIAAFLAGLIVVLSGWTWFRLRSLRSGPGNGGSGPGTGSGEQATNADADERISRQLRRLPMELLWLTLVYGLVVVPLYHVIHYVVMGFSLQRVDEFRRNNFIRSFLFEVAIALTAAIFHYTVARRLVRPYLVRLVHAQGERRNRSSLLSMLTTTFAVLLLINLMMPLWYVWMAELKEFPIEWPVLLSLVALEAVFAAVIFMLLVLEFRGEIHLLTARLLELLHGQRSRTSPKLPVLSGDEIGQLAIAFNRLHDRLNSDYEEVARELRLARQLQLRLLPPAYAEIAGCRIAAACEPRYEVGRGLYDVIPLEGGGFAALAGEVTGEGMPAALQMSALLLLLRAEVHADRTPREILQRFGAVLREVYPQEAEISVGLVIVDGSGRHTQAALQNRICGWVQEADGGGRTLERDELLRLEPGDRLVLYSESAGRAVTLSNLSALSGLAAQAASAAPGGGQLQPEPGPALALLRPELPLAEQLPSGWDRMGPAAESGGDLTLLLIACDSDPADRERRSGI